MKAWSSDMSEQRWLMDGGWMVAAGSSSYAGGWKVVAGCYWRGKGENFFLHPTKKLCMVDLADCNTNLGYHLRRGDKG